MAGHGAGAARSSSATERPLVGATMFGVTTPCVTRARERLEARGYEVLVFHATGTGGRAMEALVEAGFLAGVLDVTTTELCDDLVGGVLSAGPGPARGGGPRRAAAGRLARRARHGQLRRARHGAAAVRGPQPVRAQPVGHADAHDARRSAPSSAGGSRASSSAATGPVALFVPLRGVSMIDAEGQPFHDPEADAALFDGAARGRRRTTSSWSSWTATSTTRRSPTRWPTSSTRT